MLMSHSVEICGPAIPGACLQQRLIALDSL